MKDKETLLVSVSGGRTSAYMAWWIHNHPEEVKRHLDASTVEVIYLFANTGFEHDATLDFLRDIEKNVGIDITWIEAHPYQGERKGCEPRVVNYETAYRWHQWEDEEHPYHAHVKKYGVPNMRFPTCSSTMKRDVIVRYMKQVRGLRPKDFATAIGIRTDEQRRVSKSETQRQRIVYPLVHWAPTDKEEVIEFFSYYDWDLKVPEHMGNCITCFKKGFRKLASVCRRLPEAFDFNEAMEARYGLVRSQRTKYAEPRALTFWNKKMPTSYIRELAKVDDQKPLRDEVNSCSESCEVFETEMIQETLFEFGEE